MPEDPIMSADSTPEAASRLGRRPFLKAMLYGGAAVTAVAAGSFAWLRRSPVDDKPVPDWVANLKANEYHLFSHLLPVLLPVAGTSLTPLEQVPVMRNIDHMMGLLAPHIRKDVAAGLVLLDNAAVVSGWHGKRLVDLTEQDTVAYLDAWSRGNTIQKALQGLVKQFVYSSYWREPATWPPVNFHGAVSEDWGLAYLGNAPLPAEDQSKSGEAQA
jgi:hypothetical protein